MKEEQKMRILIRLICLPMMLATFVLMIAVKFVSHISGIAFGILSFLFLLVAGLSVLFGYNLPMAKDFLFGAVVFIVIPIGIGLAEGIVEVVNSVLVREVFG